MKAKWSSIVSVGCSLPGDVRAHLVVLQVGNYSRPYAETVGFGAIITTNWQPWSPAKLMRGVALQLAKMSPRWPTTFADARHEQDSAAMGCMSEQI